MDDAEVVGQTGGYWVVRSHDRKYFLNDAQFARAEEPHVGQKGWLGYVQRPASRVMMFTDKKPQP